MNNKTLTRHLKFTSLFLVRITDVTCLDTDGNLFDHTSIDYSRNNTTADICLFGLSKDKIRDETEC